LLYLRHAELSPLLLKINNALFLLLATWTVFDYGLKGTTYQLLHHNAEAFGAKLGGEYFLVASFVFIFFIIIEVVIGFIPGLLIHPLGGILFNPIVGTVYILIGNALGSAIAYLGGMFLCKQISSSKPSRFENYLHTKGSWGIFLLRLNPLMSFDLIPYVAGVLHLRFWHFILATVAGITPLVCALTYFGDAGHPSFLSNSLSSSS